MDIKSEPATRDETVTDLEFCFGANSQVFTLREGQDTVAYTDDQIILTFGPPLGGQVFVYKPHVQWFSQRIYVRHWPVKDPGTGRSQPSTTRPVRQAEDGPLDHS